MKLRITKRIIILAPLIIYAAVGLGFAGRGLLNQQSTAASTQQAEVDTSEYEFVFEGEVETATGRTFTLEMMGNKDADQTLSLTVKEMPALNLSGTWTFTENKGYKIFLDDATGTFAYSRYNPETKEFTVTFDYDMGNFGQPRAVLTYVDEAFADSYDGEGLGVKPPTFALEGYTTYSHYGYGTIVCAEDGSVSAQLTNTGAGWYFNRNGNWTYDEAENTYDIVFTDDTISLTDGNLDIHEDPAGNYVMWTRFTRDNPEAVYGEQLFISDLEDTYHCFTDPYVYHATYDEETNSYYIEIEAQYNWGLGHGDIVTFSGYASLADMES